MLRAHQIIRTNLGKATARQEENYNLKAHFHPYKAGDVVLIRNVTRVIGHNPKLQFPYEGPFLITERKNDLNYVLQLNAKGKRKLIHYEKMKSYPAEPPKWISEVQKKLLEQ